MGKVTKIIRKTASVMLASVMAGSACYAPVMAAPATGTSQSFSLGRVGTILDSVKGLISGDGAIEKDSHKKADTFASKRLIVKADKLKNIDKKKVIASYDGYYLLKYKSKKDARKAYEKYSAKANGKSAIAADQPVHMATGNADAGGLTNVTKKDNPLAELKDNVSDITKAEVKKAEKKKVIALLDTGASRSSNVIESVSMLGGSGDDDNGHGEAMVKAITKENKKAQIISIKVLDKNGEGSVSSIVSGIAYAEKRGASIVNLSLSGLATEGNAVVTTAVNDAIRKGLTVVGAAGNNARDAKFYIPGSISEAIIVGACDKSGNRIASSNYGETVDYNAVANSTSEAAALMSGYLSLHMNKDGSYSMPTDASDEFFRPGQTTSDEDAGKNSVTVGDFNTEVKLYYAGKQIGTLGKSTNKYEIKNIKLSSMKVSTTAKAIEVIYPNGTAQHFTNKKIVVNLSSGNYGHYIIQSLTDDSFARVQKDEPESIFKKPQSVKAMNDRDSSGKFKAQLTEAPSHITGYAYYEARPHGHSPYYIRSVHVDGVPAEDVKWKGKARCIEIAHETDEGSDGSKYVFLSSTKGQKVGQWQWYKVITFRASKMPWRPSYTVKGWQRLQIQVAVRVKTIEKVSRTVKKVWVNHDKEAVKVRLKRYKNGKSDGWVTGVVTLNNGNNWKHTTEDLPKESEGGAKYTYKWIEISTFKKVNKKTTSSGTTDTITNTGPKPEPTSSSVRISIDKNWLGDEEPDNIEVLARVKYKHNTYNVDKDGKRTTLKESKDEQKDYTVSADSDWQAKDEDSFKVNDKEKESYSDFKWYEQGWRYKGESAWRDGTPPGWEKGDAGAGYPGKNQGMVNGAAPTTKMVIDKSWTNTEVADSIVMHLYGTTPEGTIDCGEVTLTKASGWHGEIQNASIRLTSTGEAVNHALPVYWTRNQLGQLDYHIPLKYDDGFKVDEATAEQYRIKYYWEEDTAKTTFQGNVISKLIANCKIVSTEQPDDGDYAEGGSGEAENTSVNPSLTSYAVDATTGTKAGKVVIGADGEKYMEINETVNMWNVGPGNQYTLITGVIKNDGTSVTPAWQETTFIPNQINTFKYTEDHGTFVSLNVKAEIACGDFDPAGSAIVVTEELIDDNDETVAVEENPSNKDQTIYYPTIKTHMVSENPLNDLAHKYDGTFDSDGKHYGATAENESDRGITLSDTVTYKNLYSGSYIIRGELHRKDRNSDHDFGVVATAESGVNVNAGDGAADGTTTVKYSFNYTDDMFGSDFVSYERLYYIGNGHNDELASHADINDKSQTVRMPTRIRIIKKDQETDQAQPHALIGLYTKDANGDLHEYMHNGKHYVLETDNNGVALFCNLDPGEYWFKELKTSEGHNLMATPFSTNAEYYKTRQMILGEQKTQMLTTGGSGTTMYYIAAGIVAAGCAVAYVIKKRKKAK